MCISPTVDDVKRRKSFYVLSSSVCLGVYSTLLITLLCVVNTQAYTEEHWQNFYLNPSIPEELEKLNYLVVSLIVVGAVSTGRYRMISCVKTCKDVVKKIHYEEESESEVVKMEPIMPDQLDSEVVEKVPDHAGSEVMKNINEHDDFDSEIVEMKEDHTEFETVGKVHNHHDSESEVVEMVHKHDNTETVEMVEDYGNSKVMKMVQEHSHSEVIEKVHDHIISDSEVVKMVYNHNHDDSAVMDMMNDHGGFEAILEVESHNDSKVVDKEHDHDDFKVVNSEYGE